MRKELKSKSRRKWLIGGSLAFASVALLTTGFATWVIGTQKTSGDGQVHIGVDTVEDKSVELAFELDNTNDNDTIFVAESAGTSNSNLTIEQAGTPDWDIKIKNLNIVVGEAFYNSLKAKQEEKQKAGQDLDLKIAFELQKDVADDKNLVTEDKVKVRGEGSSWNYIRIKTNDFIVNLPNAYPAGGKIYDINDTSHNSDEKTFSFDWGSYFGEKAPSVFYKENEPTEGKREYYQKAGQELQAMNTALNNGELKLTATFVYEK